jgi:NDP-sugar pyrophosphorylase family protein
MTKDVQIIIPMSGFGSRFIAAGYLDPKPLIEVDGFPMIRHIVNLFDGCEDIIFICNEIHLLNTSLKSVLLDLAPTARILSSPENLRGGPVRALLHFQDYINTEKEVIVSYCDFSCTWRLQDFLNDARERQLDGSLACYTGFHPHMLGEDHYAYVSCDSMGLAYRVDEKSPTKNNKFEEIASAGIYYFKSGGLLKKFATELSISGPYINEELYVSLVYNNLILKKGRVGYFLVKHMLQWGTPYDLSVYQSWSNYFLELTKPKIINTSIKATTLIPMAGHGSRFSESGYALPKPLLQVDSLPMVVQAVNCLPKTDSLHFVILRKHVMEFDIKNQLKSHFPNATFTIISDTTDGQATTCSIALNEMCADTELPILISACDNGVLYNHHEFERLLSEDNDVIVWSFRNNPTSKINPNMYSWLKINDSGFVTSVKSKCYDGSNPLNDHAIVGTMYFKRAGDFLSAYLDNVDEKYTTNGEYYVDDLLNNLIRNGLKVKPFESTNYICWGTPTDYETYLYWLDFFSQCMWHPFGNRPS